MRGHVCHRLKQDRTEGAAHPAHYAWARLSSSQTESNRWRHPPRALCVGTGVIVSNRIEQKVPAAPRIMRGHGCHCLKQNRVDGATRPAHYVWGRVSSS